MRYVSTPAQDELRAEVRAFLAEASPPAEVRRLMETEGYDLDGRGADRSVRLGRGGSDLGFAELAVVLEEAGAALLCAPLLGTAVARGCRRRQAAPGCLAALAVAEDAGRWDAEAA